MSYTIKIKKNICGLAKSKYICGGNYHAMAVNQYDRSYDNMKDDILYSLRALIKQVMPAGTKVFLFGSQARGDVHDESDWDILILLDKEKITSADFDTYAYPLIDLGWQFGEYFSTKLYTFTEWMKRKGTPFFKNVELDGIEL